MSFLRVSQSTQYLNALNDIKTVRDRYDALQRKLVSGKEINKASDDPIGAQQVLNFNNRIDENAQFQRNIDFSRGRLSITESTLGQIEDILIEIKSVSQQSSSTASSSAERASGAIAVEALLDEVIQLANTKYLGKFLFGGTNILSGTFANSAPFNVTSDSNGYATAVTQNPRGIDDLIYREMSDGLEIAVNISGSAPFMPNGENGTGDIFRTIIGIRDAMATNDSAAIISGTAGIESALDQVTNQEVVVGIRANRIDKIQGQLESKSIAIKEQRSAIEDADYAELLVQMATAETALTATLQTSATLLQISLLNFL